MASFGKIFKYLLAAAFVGLVLVLLFYRGYLFDDSQKKTPPPEPVPADSDNRPQLMQTVITSKKDGKKYWDLSADKIAFDQNSKIGDAKEVFCRFYDDNEVVYITFKSSRADLDMNTQSVKFNEPSYGTLLKSGDKIEVRRLFWDGEKKKLFGYDGVKMYRSDYVITSLEMIGDPTLRNVELIKDVVGVWEGPVSDSPLRK